MFSNNTEGFILFNIYFLIVVNIGILVSIYYQIVKSHISKNKYIKAKNELSEIIYNYIENYENLEKLKAKLKSSYKKTVATDILSEYFENNNVDISKISEDLELDLFLITKIKKKSDIKHIKKLAYMKIPASYEVLLDNSNSDDLDIKYTCYFGLSMLGIEKEKKYYIINKLIKSNILSDRIIEILNKVDLKFEEWMYLLENEKSEGGKVILLKTISTKEEIKDEVYSDRLLNFLNDSKEIKIAAITAICSSENEKYVEMLYDIFKTEEQWEVRVAITKGMTNYSPSLIKDKLLYMIKDKEWWVRFNAAKAISLMGEEGIYTLIELFIDKSNENASTIAYYFLETNKNIHETIQTVEV